MPAEPASKMTDQDTPHHPPTDRPWLTRLARFTLVFYWPALAVATHWPRLSITGKPNPPRSEPMSLLQIDKAGHLVMFSLLAVLLILAKPIGRRRSAFANRIAAAGIALAYSFIDEFTQALPFVFERTVSASDLLANAISVVGVLLVAMTPRVADPAPDAAAVRSARRRTLAAVVGIFLGGLILSASGTVNRETYAVHFVAGAALTLMLMRAAPVLPNRPRVSTALALLAVGGTVVAAEVARIVELAEERNVGRVPAAERVLDLHGRAVRDRARAVKEGDGAYVH